MRSLAFAGRVGAVALALLALVQGAFADAVKTVDEAVAASKKSGKPILTIMGTKT